MPIQEVLLFLVAACGHLVIWCAIFNQVHATSLPRWMRKVFEKTVYVLVAGLLVLLFLRLIYVLDRSHPLLTFYSFLCLGGFALIVLQWLYRKLTSGRPDEVVSVERELIDIGQDLDGQKFFGLQGIVLGMVPFNEVLKLSVERRVVRLNQWPAELDGMVIAHISDLHFTGKISRDYFRRVVEQCNQYQADFVFLTGDIVDKEECISWLPETLGRLTSRHGKYYVLGNHDQRIKEEVVLRAAIEQQGFHRADGKWQTVEYQGGTFSLAGDELPWYPGAEQLAEVTGPSILMAHSPDRIYAASRLGVDLVLAGHCHGGQIRIPFIGPIIAPSKYGVRFASGSFKIGSTLMHVSRGVSGDEPIRLNCPPELNILEVRSKPDPTT